MLYPVIIEFGDEDGAFGVIVPDIAGCISAGDSFEEALENAKEAIVGHIEMLVEDGEKIPVPSEIKSHWSNGEHEGLIFALIDVDLTHLMGEVEEINIFLPKELIKEIKRIVANDSKYKNISEFLADVSLEKVIKF